MLQILDAAINSIVFSPQWLNISLFLQESADVTCTQPRDPPTTSLLYAYFLAIREKIFDSSRKLKQDFHDGSSLPQPPCYQLVLCPNFDSWFDPTITVQDWPWTYSLSQSLHKTFFSAPPCHRISLNLSRRYQPQKVVETCQLSPFGWESPVFNGNFRLPPTFLKVTKISHFSLSSC